MPEPRRFPPDDPREWLKRARSDMRLAQSRHADVVLEDLCFHAQQAAEKAIKAVLLKRNIRFPHTHDIAALLRLIKEAGVSVPPETQEAQILTAYAGAGRCPGVVETVTVGEHDQAVALANTVVAWADRLLQTEPPAS